MFCMICMAVVCPFKIGQFVMMILQVLSFMFVMAVFGLFMGVIKPVLTWTNELTPIKQSASVMITMFGGFGYTALLFIGYMVLPGYTLGYMLYIGIFIVANVVLGLTKPIRSSIPPAAQVAFGGGLDTTGRKVASTPSSTAAILCGESGTGLRGTTAVGSSTSMPAAGAWPRIPAGII